jgi:hypothetical protein
MPVVKFANYKELILALVLALALWYDVSGSEKLEAQVDVRVEYRGLPPGLVVSGGYVGKVSLRLRASAGVLRSVTERDFSVQMDLSGVREGENMLAVNPSYLPMRGGVEVIDVVPSRIALRVDALASKTIPLAALVQGVVPGGIELSVSLVPSEAKISGGASVLGDIEKLDIPVRIESPLTPGTKESRRALPLPDGVDADPAEVAVVVRVDVKRRPVGVVRSVLFDAEAAGGRVAVPGKVHITVRLPESAAAGAAADPRIRAYVRREHGVYAGIMPVQVDLPDDMELLGVDPSRVIMEKPAPSPKARAARAPAKKKTSDTGSAASRPAPQGRKKK